MTPLPLTAESDPDGTEKVTVTELPPASASEKEMPVTAAAVSSVRAIAPGAEICGASLTEPTSMVFVAGALSLVPSLVLKLIVRAAAVGASEVFK
ncbi:hypothetical protein F2981_16350 [Sinorhizobium meliloti]|nr:hypothetical protein [Sinorhizobium meliloti]